MNDSVIFGNDSVTPGNNSVTPRNDSVTPVSKELLQGIARSLQGKTQSLRGKTGLFHDKISLSLRGDRRSSDRFNQRLEVKKPGFGGILSHQSQLFPFKPVFLLKRTRTGGLNARLHSFPRQ